MSLRSRCSRCSRAGIRQSTLRSFCAERCVVALAAVLGILAQFGCYQANTHRRHLEREAFVLTPLNPTGDHDSAHVSVDPDQDLP